MLRYLGFSFLALSVIGMLPAAADNFVPGIYSVVSYDALWPTYKDGVGQIAPDLLNGAGVAEGWRFNRYYAIEGSYDYTEGSNSILRLTAQRASLDGMGFLPMGRNSDIAPYSDIGVSYVFGGASAAGAHSTNSSFGPHIGAGVQFQFNDYLGLRVGAQYQWTNFDTISGATVAMVGLVFKP